MMKKTAFDRRAPEPGLKPPSTKPVATREPGRKDSTSSFKEIQRLQQENARLSDYVHKLEEELSTKEEFSQALSQIAEDRPDMRRTALYRAKLCKQERLISLQQAALESQKHLYFEIEKQILNIAEILKGSEKPEERLFSIGSIIKTARRGLREAEKASQVAYMQLLNNNKVKQTVTIENDVAREWKASIQLDGSLILEVENKLGELLNMLVTCDLNNIMPVMRESCNMLLNLGIRLPSHSEISKKAQFSKDLKKNILNCTKPTARDTVIAIIDNANTRLSNAVIEKEMVEKELESCRLVLENLKKSVEEFGEKTSNRNQGLKHKLERSFIQPFEDIWVVWDNMDENSSAFSLLAVLKMNAPIIKGFIDELKQDFSSI